MDRLYELENLRRSLAMLPPGTKVLDREEAMRLLAELQEPCVTSFTADLPKSQYLVNISPGLSRGSQTARGKEAWTPA